MINFSVQELVTLYNECVPNNWGTLRVGDGYGVKGGDIILDTWGKAILGEFHNLLSAYFDGNLLAYGEQTSPWRISPADCYHLKEQFDQRIVPEEMLTTE